MNTSNVYTFFWYSWYTIYFSLGVKWREDIFSYNSRTPTPTFLLALKQKHAYIPGKILTKILQGTTVDETIYSPCSNSECLRCTLRKIKVGSSDYF